MPYLFYSKMVLIKKRKRGNNIKTGNAGHAKKKKNSEETDSDEISSESELEDNDLKPELPITDSEDENETAQEKKMRLTKKYLDELRTLQEQREDGVDAVGTKLEEEVLDKAGRLQRKVADKFATPTSDDISVLKGHRLTVTCMAVSQNGDMVFTGSKDCSIIKWGLSTKKKLATIQGGKKLKSTSKHHTGHVLCLALTSDGTYLASGSIDKLILIWSPETCSHIHTFAGHRDGVLGLAFRTNSHQLFSSSQDRTVKVWDLDTMGYVETLYGHQDSVTACDSLIRERCVTAGGRDGTIRVWKIVEESQLVYHGHTGSVDCVKFINEEHMISGSDDGSICLWGSMKKRPLFTIKNAHNLADSSRQTWITAVCSMRNSDLVATGSSDGYIRLWKCGDRSLSPLFTVPVLGFVNDLNFVNNDTLIAAVGQEHKLGRWWKLKESKNVVMVIKLPAVKT
uniref:U3 small nucleolar RNA-interacting protein 2 n=2 Tax=Ciona intestinalis TaxID=7719 RepID=F6SP32_CIOIN